MMIKQDSPTMHATLLDLIKSIDPYVYPSNPLVHPRDNARMTPFHLVIGNHHVDPPILPIGHIHPTILIDMLAYNVETVGESFTFYPAMGPRPESAVLRAVKAVAFSYQAVNRGKDALTGIIDGLVDFMRKRGTVPEDKCKSHRCVPYACH